MTYKEREYLFRHIGWLMPDYLDELMNGQEGAINVAGIVTDGSPIYYGSNIISACTVALANYAKEAKISPKEAIETLNGKLISKGEDYANADVLSVFKSVAHDHVQPLDVCAIHIRVKVARLLNLQAKGSQPNYEALSDNALDLAGYLFLYYCLCMEGRIFFDA